MDYYLKYYDLFRVAFFVKHPLHRILARDIVSYVPIINVNHHIVILLDTI